MFGKSIGLCIRMLKKLVVKQRGEILTSSLLREAIKSVTWFTTKGKLLEKFTSRHNSGHCIVKKGVNFKNMIKEIKTSGKVL